MCPKCSRDRGSLSREQTEKHNEGSAPQNQGGEKKWKKRKSSSSGLLPKLIIAIIIGILFGQFLPEGFCRFVVTLSSFFSQFLSFIIPLMILAYVTMGIANLKSGAGKLLLITVAHRLLLDPHRRLGFVLRVRHPVPAFHER